MQCKNKTGRERQILYDIIYMWKSFHYICIANHHIAHFKHIVLFIIYSSMNLRKNKVDRMLTLLTGIKENV